MRRGGEHKKFETYQSFRRFEDELVDCGVFSEEWRFKMLTFVEACMNHAYQRGHEQALLNHKEDFICQSKEKPNISSDPDSTL